VKVVLAWCPAPAGSVLSNDWVVYGCAGACRTAHVD
jgi:hypothetical protein